MLTQRSGTRSLTNLKPEQILENRIGQSLDPENRFTFLDELASDKPTPGGGSAAAFTAAQAAALAEMVARLTIGKKKYIEVESEMREAAGRANELRKKLIVAIAEDSQAFEALMADMHLPKSTPEEIENRNNAILQSTLAASEAPLKTAELALDVMRLLALAAEKGNINAITDAGSGAALAFAAITAAGANVRTNLAGYPENHNAHSIIAGLDDIEKESLVIYAAVKKSLELRAKISLL